MKEYGCFNPELAPNLAWTDLVIICRDPLFAIGVRMTFSRFEGLLPFDNSDWYIISEFGSLLVPVFVSNFLILDVAMMFFWSLPTNPTKVDFERSC